MLQNSLAKVIMATVIELIPLATVRAQTQQPKPSDNPYASPQEAQRENFPPQLLEELAAIKTAARL